MFPTAPVFRQVDVFIASTKRKLEGNLPDSLAWIKLAFLRPRRERNSNRFCGGNCGGTEPLGNRHVVSDCNHWWARQDSNLQPDRYERPALTIELQAPPRDGRGGAAGNGARFVYRDGRGGAMPGRRDRNAGAAWPGDIPNNRILG